MIPDKIFIDEDLIAFHVLQTKHDGDIEYIRKDALLEWAKERKEQMKIEAAGCSNMLAAGEWLAYDKLIEKIESM